MFRIEPVTERTFKRIIDMKLSGEQCHYVASNLVSLAQAWLYYEDTRPMAVCDGDEVVGFMMLDWDDEERSVGIWRFMIATEKQRMGYGRKAMEEAIKLCREAGNIDFIHLDYVKGNEVARKLYCSMGFRETGKVEGDEIIMILPLTDSPKVGMLTSDDDDTEDIVDIVEKDFPDIDKDALKEFIKEGKVKRFSLMGDTIGFSLDGKLYIAKDKEAYRQEAESLFSEK